MNATEGDIKVVYLATLDVLATVLLLLGAVLAAPWALIVLAPVLAVIHFSVVYGMSKLAAGERYSRH